jgi:hypothetical protein
VPERRLYRVHRHPAPGKVGGEGVAERVRVDALPDAGLAREPAA